MSDNLDLLTELVAPSPVYEWRPLLYLENKRTSLTWHVFLLAFVGFV